GIVVEVHESQGLAENLWYHVGVLTGGYCAFGESIEYDSGVTPSVACNDKGVVLEVHKSNGFSSKLWYHVGSVNASTKTLDWGDSHDYEDDGGAPANLTVFDSYSSTNSLNAMIINQFAKMEDVANHGGDLFLLSWTLTQDVSQASACG